MKRLLSGRAFELPLTAAGQRGRVTVWGRGDYRRLAAGDDVDWDGDLSSGHLGADLRVSATVLAGVAGSWSQGEFAYTQVGGRGMGEKDLYTGQYTSDLKSVHPYVHWRVQPGLAVWGTLGYGWGEIEIAEIDSPEAASDTTMRMAAVGGTSQVLEAAGLLSEGTTRLRVKGEALLAQVRVEGNGGVGDAAVPVDGRGDA